MRLTLITLIGIISFGKLAYCQIEIEDKSAEPEIKAVPYTGDFMTFDGIYNNSVKAGVVGEKVTLIDVKTFSIYSSKEDLKNYKNIDFSLRDNFQNKTFEVIDYHVDIYDILTIKNESGEFLWKVTGSDDYVFNKSIDIIKEKFTGKTFIPLHNSYDFESLDGNQFQIEGSQKYTVTKVVFAKIKLDYGIVLEFNETFESEFPLDSYSQPRIFNGTRYTTNDNYINISNSFGKVTLIEENEFVIFSKNNKMYLETIRYGKVKVGMSETQCRWALGMPSNSLDNIVGYDEVLVYGNSLYLYFIGGILKLIK